MPENNHFNLTLRSNSLAKILKIVQLCFKPRVHYFKYKLRFVTKKLSHHKPYSIVIMIQFVGLTMKIIYKIRNTSGLSFSVNFYQPKYLL